MTIKEQLQKDLILFMKEKNETEVLTIRSMITELSNNEKVKGNSKTEIDVLKTLLKQRNQSAEEYTNAGNNVLAEKEKNEAKIIERYLPKQMSEEEIRLVITDIINEIYGFDKSKMGQVIGAFNKIHPGQNGKLVADIVRTFL